MNTLREEGHVRVVNLVGFGGEGKVLDGMD